MRVDVNLARLNINNWRARTRIRGLNQAEIDLKQFQGPRSVVRATGKKTDHKLTSKFPVVLYLSHECWVNRWPTSSAG